MSTRLYVDFGGNWYQLMDSPVSSREVLERMEMLAKSALLQFVHQTEVTVTAIEGDVVRQLVRTRGQSTLRKSCPHCGGFL